MGEESHRLNLTLDAERAERLKRLAERTHLQEGTLARSLLSAAIDEADTDPRNVVALLDGISGAYERAELSRRQLRAGAAIPLDPLAVRARPTRPIGSRPPLVASVVVGPPPPADLAELILAHSLPQDTPERVAR